MSEGGNMTALSLSSPGIDMECGRDFQLGFDRKPFAFSHHLNTLEQFSLPSLVRLANRMSSKPGRWYIEEGDTKPENGWGLHSSASLEPIIQNIGESNSLVILKRVHEDTEYRPILEQVSKDLAELSGIDLPSHYRDGMMTVLITSPHRVTPYHIDGEANLLVQIKGTKTVYIFDGNDREVLPSDEIEGFWAGNHNAVHYKADLQQRAQEYELAPGRGVSNPVAFPHWVKNGAEVSVSVSINYKRLVDDQADAHKLNHRLRGFGLHPTEPGKTRFVDRLKGLAYRAAKRAKRRK